MLLDTHVWLWLQVSPERVSRRIRERLEDPRSRLLFSAASAWEIAIKWAIGKLPLPEPPARYIPDRLRRQSILSLPIGQDHALAVADLPPHHGDPFDRLLVVQAQIERLPIVTVDPAFAAYDIEVIRADQE